MSQEGENAFHRVSGQDHTGAKRYHNGPIPNEDRKCTDWWCLIIFLLLLVIMFIFGIYSWFAGNFSKLKTPYDPDQKGCGVDYPDHPYIYFASPHHDSLWVTVCLKKCPKETDSQLDCQPNSVVKTCQPVNNADNQKSVEIYDSSEFGGTVCIPTSDKISKEISSALGSETIEDAMVSLSKSWTLILIAIPLAIILSLVFMAIIKFTAGFFVYLLLIFAVVVLVALGIYLFIPAEEGSNLFVERYRAVSIIVGIICLLLAAAIVVLMICYRKRIQLASSIVKVAVKFVTENCAIMFMPLILFLIMIFFVALWVFQMLGFYSLGQPVTQEHQLPFQHFQMTGMVKALLIINFFCLFWVMFFLIETSDFVIGGAATSWYFRREDPYSESTTRYRKFHIGSVCMGSFLLAVLGFTKFMYEILVPEEAEEGCLKSYKKFCTCCCYCCVTYLFECLNSGAYTFIHLNSDHYCSAAWEVVKMKLKQPIATGVVMLMQVIFSVLVRLTVTATTCLISYAMLGHMDPWKKTVSHPSATLVVIGLLAFTIASLFLSVYSEAMDAIFVCYLADKDAGGGEDRCPDELREFLDEAKGRDSFKE